MPYVWDFTSFWIHTTVLYANFVRKHIVENSFPTGHGMYTLSHISYENGFQRYTLRAKQYSGSSTMWDFTSYWMQTTVLNATHTSENSFHAGHGMYTIECETVFNRTRCAQTQSICHTCGTSHHTGYKQLFQCATHTVENSFHTGRGM